MVQPLEHLILEVSALAWTASSPAPPPVASALSRRSCPARNRPRHRAAERRTLGSLGHVLPATPRTSAVSDRRRSPAPPCAPPAAPAPSPPHHPRERGR